jgi:hypothetical protein
MKEISIMNHKSRFLWLLAVLLALPILACGLGGNTGETSNIEETSHNETTNENAAAPTNTPLPNVTQIIHPDTPVGGTLDANTQTYTFTVPAGATVDITLTYEDGYSTYATFSRLGKCFITHINQIKQAK